MYNVHLITRKRAGKKKNDRKQAGKQAWLSLKQRSHTW